MFVLVVGGVIFYVGSGNYLIRSVGLIAVLASTYFVRLSRLHTRAGLAAGGNQRLGLETQSGPGRLLWVVSLALLPAAIGAYFLLYVDALHGSHEVWPVYLFAGVGVVCAVVWSLLAAKLAGWGAGGSSY